MIQPVGGPKGRSREVEVRNEIEGQLSMFAPAVLPFMGPGHLPIEDEFVGLQITRSHGGRRQLLRLCGANRGGEKVRFCVDAR